MTRWLLLAGLLGVLAFAPRCTHQADLVVGSKKFTESVILGEMSRLLVETAGADVLHLRELGGTRLLFEALLQGEIDVYPEYTGTLLREIYAGQGLEGAQDLAAALAASGLAMTRPLGFNNSYAIGMLAETAQERGFRTIGDLSRDPGLALGFTSEFLERADGWPGLAKRYALPHRNVRGLDHDVAVRQLALGVLDAVDVYTTEARIPALGIQLLEDDRGYFPRYDAVLLYRVELAARAPALHAALCRLEGALVEEQIATVNRAVEIDGASEAAAAADFLRSEFGLEVEDAAPSVPARVLATTLDHLDLVRRSLLPALLCAVPLGVLAARMPWLGQVVLAAAGIIQTIPALALLVLLMPLVAAFGLGSVGAGSWTAVLALFLYSLLPMIRGTHTGLITIPRELRESATALGLTPWFRLFRVELPLASRSILAGIQTAAVLNVGFATLGALVGAGGYGQPILSGIRLASTPLVLEGALPAAALAVGVHLGCELAKRWLVPRGLRHDQAAVGPRS